MRTHRLNTAKMSRKSTSLRFLLLFLTIFSAIAVADFNAVLQFRQVSSEGTGSSQVSKSSSTPTSSSKAASVSSQSSTRQTPSSSSSPSPTPSPSPSPTSNEGSSS